MAVGYPPVMTLASSAVPDPKLVARTDRTEIGRQSYYRWVLIICVGFPGAIGLAARLLGRGGIFVLSLGLCWHCSAEEPMPPSSGKFARRYLAVDQGLHADLSGVRLRMGQASNQRLILAEFDQAWEREHDVGRFEYCSVIPDHTGGYRLYYNVKQPHAEGRREMMAVAFSRDGLRWEKPALNVAPDLVDHPDSNLINIVSHPGMVDGRYYRSGPVFYDPLAPPQSRYKLSWRVVNEVYVASSSDGLSFTTHGRAFEHTADTQHAAFYDAARGEYVMYGRKRKDWTSGDPDRRGVPRHSSRKWDDIPWTDVGRVVIDPMDVWDYEQPIGPQLYAPAIQPYHGQYIGLPAVFFVDRRRPSFERTDRNTGTFYPMFMHSGDGVAWHFPDLQHPIVELEPHERISTYEHASFEGSEVGMLCTATQFLELEDRLLIYYTAREANHYEPCPPDRSSIHVAQLRVDGFGSLATVGEQTGYWLTTPIEVPERTTGLQINASVHGSLGVEVLETEGLSAVAGFALADAVPLDGDRLDHLSVWTSAEWAELAGRSIQLRFSMREAEIFSFTLLEQ